MSAERVAVLMGGWSAEREISYLSGRGVLAALQARGVDAFAFDPAERDLDELRREGAQRCFIALHGRGGEDGTIQGALELLGIPYTGSGVLGSAIGMDKRRTKMLWLAAGLPTPRYRMLGSAADAARAADELGLPMIVKPTHEGSTLGLTRVSRADQLAAAWVKAGGERGEAVIAEAFIDGPEYTASILGETALPLIRIEAPDGNYDYQNKYFDDRTRYDCPSGLDADREVRLSTLALDAFRIAGCSGWGRIDLMLDQRGEPWLLEVNTAPGMTSHSLVPMAARAVGLGYEDLCLRILASASLHGALHAAPAPRDGRLRSEEKTRVA